jgi:hypothetical protein
MMIHIAVVSIQIVPPNVRENAATVLSPFVGLAIVARQKCTNQSCDKMMLARVRKRGSDRAATTIGKTELRARAPSMSKAYSLLMPILV